MNFAICNEMFEGWSFEKVCEHVASLGYHAVELAPFTFADDPHDLDESWARKTAATAGSFGLRIAGLHWLLIKPTGLHVTGADSGVRERTTRFVQHLARLCGAAGGKVLVWGSPAQRSVVEGDDPAVARRRAVEVFRAVAEVAGDCGVTVALEPLAPKLTNFMTTADEAVSILREVDHPACRLHLDVNAMSSEATPIPEIIRRHHRDLVHFHANDPNLLGPGMGDVEYGPILRALADVGYDGDLSVEVFAEGPGPEAIAARSIQYLRRTLTEQGLEVPG